jgi:hypothetical protein
VQEFGSTSYTFVEIKDELDVSFKPGLYRQTENFLSGKYLDFCTLGEQVKAFETYYQQICPYEKN